MAHRPAGNSCALAAFAVPGVRNPSTRRAFQWHDRCCRCNGRYRHLTVTWSAVGNATSYRLHWTDDGSEPSATSTVITTTSPQYQHTGLAISKTYRYRVSALNEKGESALSATAEGTPDAMRLSPPTGLHGNVAGSTANLDWDDSPVANARYDVRRDYTTVASGLDASRYSEALPREGVAFEYRVKVVVPDMGESDWSAPVVLGSRKLVTEVERNGPSSWSSSGSWYFSGNSAIGLQYFTLQGGYSGTYAIYQPASYKYFDYDVFKVSVSRNDTVTVSVTRGAGSGPWSMSVELVCVTTSGGGVLRDMALKKFTGSGDSYTLVGGVQDCTYTHLDVVMPVDVGASYTYSIDVAIAGG